MNGRKGMLAVFGAFAAPAILAYIVLKMGWFNAGATNKGEFMDKELTLNWILPEQAKDSQWVIFYRMPDSCDQTCQNVLYSLNQGFQALGKEQDKAHPVTVLADGQAQDHQSIKQQYNFIRFIPGTNAQQPTLSQLSSQYLYLVDPLGKVVLRYPAKPEREAMIMVTKDWMADLKRLLKYARTG